MLKREFARLNNLDSARIVKINAIIERIDLTLEALRKIASSGKNSKRQNKCLAKELRLIKNQFILNPLVQQILPDSLLEELTSSKTAKKSGATKASKNTDRPVAKSEQAGRCFLRL